MGGIVEKMARYHRMSLLCAAGTVFFLIAAAVLYFRLDIRNVWRSLSVRRAKREIRRLEETAAKEDGEEEKTELLTKEKKEAAFRKARKSLPAVFLCVTFLCLKAEAEAEEVPFSVVSDREANPAGWAREDTTFTLTVSEEIEEGWIAECRKREEEEWTPMQEEESGKVFTFTETDVCYEGAYQFRLRNGELICPEKGGITKELKKDRQPPEISVKTGREGKEEKGRIFFAGEGGQKEVVKMTFAEDFYEKQTDQDGKPVKPQVTIWKDESLLSLEETEALIRWGEFHDGGISVWAELPYEENKETVYRVCASYTDVSGNQLETAEDSLLLEEEDAQEGSFRSRELVLDAKAPGLTVYRMEGKVNAFVKTTEDRLPVYENRAEADVKAVFTIDDSEEFWNREEVRIFLWETGKQEAVRAFRGDDAAVRWKDEGNFHTAVCSFDAEKGKEASCRIGVTYRDAAGHSMKDEREDKTSGGLLEETEEGGSYKSSAFVLDAKQPEFSVAYPEAVRTIRKGRDHETGKRPAVGYTSYYKEDIEAVFTIQDLYLETEETQGTVSEGLRAELIWEEKDKEISVQEVTRDIRWEKTGEGSFKGSLRITGEGGRRLRIFCRDAAGNSVKVLEGENADPDKEEGYESPLLVIDRTAPRLSLSYGDRPVQRQGKRLYFGKDTVLKLTVEDENFRVRELYGALARFTAADSAGRDLREDTALFSYLEGLDKEKVVKGVFTVQLPLDTEANYQILAGGFTDLAGNKAVWAEEEEDQGPAESFEVCVTVDKTAPEKLALTCPEAETVNYAPYGWLFSQTGITVTVEAEDGTAGLRMARFWTKAEDGTVKERLHFFDEEEMGKGSFQEKLPETEPDFRGVLQAELYDWAGNCSVLTRSCAVESEEKHGETGKAEITAETEPGRVVDGTAYYRGDVRFRISLADAWSGIRNVWYEGGRTFRMEKDYAKEAGIDLEEKPFRDPLWEISEEFVLPAQENNENGAAVKAFYTDHAGHTGFAEQYFYIDVTVPEITVEYEGEALTEGRYCAGERTAVVTIRERNFREEDVEFHITNTEGKMPQIGEWSSSGSGDDTKHVCRVLFAEDGDYTFTAAFQDLAGNRAVYDRTDSFTIDRTPPELSVVWEGGKAENEHYFAAERTAVIEVNEHNFREPRIYAEEGKDEKKEKRELSAVWEKKEDVYRTRIAFREEGRFRLEIEGRDLAGNPMPVYDSKEFVIDETPPQLEITGVGDQTANKGEVCPVIRWHDENPDRSGKEVRLWGGRNRKPQLKSRENRLEDGAEILYEDFPYLPSADDLYTLEAEVRDLAGNVSRTGISFSVNRFGSVYTFDALSEALAGKNGSYYTDREQDIVVTETNVDTLEFREITCSRDGKLETLKEDRDYTVRTESSESGWKQYIYTIERKNFEEEGVYILTLYSEDRAGNSSDNDAKGKRITFAVDKTSPEILMSGIEENGQYREKKKKIILDVQDNLCLKEVSVSIDGKEKIYREQELEDMGGRIVLEAGSAGHWQELKVQACDAAGHSAGTETIPFLVTPNPLLQILLNKKGLGIWMMMLLLATAGGAGFIRRKKSGRAAEKKNGSQ